MDTAASIATGSTKVLLLCSKPITENVKWSVTMLFAQLFELIKYVCGNIKFTEEFVLIVPGDTLKNLVDDPVYNFNQVRHIYGIYDNDNDLKHYKDHIEDKHGKLRFCHERNLEALIEKLKVNDAISPSRPMNVATVYDVVSSGEQRISAKRSNAADRHSPEPKRFAFTSKHAFSIKNIEQIDSHYICPACKFPFYDPHQLQCGHRICHSCLKIENAQTICLTCSQLSSYENIWRDRGFHNEMKHLPISCSLCDWKGSLELYQNHIDQKHLDGENSAAIMDVYTQQDDQSRLSNPQYTAITHQQIMSNILSSLNSTYMPNNSNVINNRYQILLSHFQEMICFLSNRVNTIPNDQRRIDNEIRYSQTLLQMFQQNLSLLQTSSEDLISCARRAEITQDLLDQQICSLKQAVNDAQFTSFNDTYIWKITDVRDKIADARSERQKSIYSPPFYSSPTGYKMCLRLYLNGDSDTRDKHLSIYFVLMPGDFDAIIEWPFSYEVTLRLINHSTSDNQSNIFGSFVPDISSNCFQRPVYNMNHGYGIKEFFSIAELQQNQSHYVKDDTMFIEVKIDFSNKKSSISLTNGSTNDEEHVNTISENFMYLS